jgi:hypothetical protein
MYGARYSDINLTARGGAKKKSMKKQHSKKHSRKSMKKHSKKSMKKKHSRKHSKKHARKSLKRKQRGGRYTQYMSNIPYTPGYGIGSVSPATNALANPMPFVAYNNCPKNNFKGGAAYRVGATDFNPALYSSTGAVAGCPGPASKVAAAAGNAGDAIIQK